MDGTELEFTGKQPTTTGTNSVLPASYKAIPETDMEEEAATRPKSLVKSKLVSPEADGADEKMLRNDEKLAPNSKIEIGDVKISPNEKQNGEAKLDIGELKAAFVGLTKEELMKYANDPFWIRLRWFLFITFWVLWTAMLVGAIVIIYVAPKCDPPPPRTWWQQGPLAEVKSDVKLEELKALKESGIKGLVMSFNADSYASFDDSHEFIKLLKDAKEQDIHLIVDLEPGNSLVWFKQSEEKDPEVDDFYIWRPHSSINATGVPQPPNNWLNVNNESSWIYSNNRKEFYYAPMGKPHLNLRNANVSEHFGRTIKKFLEYGASGVSLRGIPTLLVDSKFENEILKPSAPGFFHTDYGFYMHTKTENLLELGPLLQKWRSIVKNVTENGPFMASDELGSNVQAYTVNNTFVIDLPLKSHVFAKTNMNATEIVKRINSTFALDSHSWPLWKYNSDGVIDVVTFLLPGAPLVSPDTKVNKDLLKIRNSPSVMRGIFSYHQVANSSVFAFIRVASGNPGVLVALNPTDERVVVDFPAEINAVSDEVTVQFFSENYVEESVALNVKQNAHNIPISPKSSIVLSYVPKAV